MEPMNISSTWEHDGENVECFIAIKKTANENWYGTIKPFPETCTMNERTERERIETAKQCSHRNTLATTQAHTHTHTFLKRANRNSRFWFTASIAMFEPYSPFRVDCCHDGNIVYAIKTKTTKYIDDPHAISPPPLPLSPSRARILRKVMKSELVLWCSHITCVSRLMRFHLILKSNNNNSSSSNQTHAHFALTFRSWHLCVFRVISADGRRFYLPFSFTHSFYRTFHSSHF